MVHLPKTLRRIDVDFEKLAKRENPFFADDIEIDPGLVDPPSWLPPERYLNGVDPEEALKKLPIHTIFELLTNLAWVWRIKRGHALFELFFHLMFPGEDEEILVHLALWKHRDLMTDTQIQKTLNKFYKPYGKLFQMKKLKIVLRYIDRRVEKFMKRINLAEKAATLLLRDRSIEQSVSPSLEEEIELEDEGVV